MSYADLAGKVAIVTGGGKGIGRAITLSLAGEGVNVSIAGRNREALDQVTAKVESIGRECLPVVTDIRIPEQVTHLVQAVMNTFGRIDILVNNAGASFICPVEDITPNGWDTVVDINLKGTFLCSQAVGKIMIRQMSGKIINIASIAGKVASPDQAHYGAAKAGIINLTKSLSVAWAKYNILVNALSLGLIETEGVKRQMKLSPDVLKKIIEKIPLARPGQPEEVANMVLFLASEKSSYMTGEDIVMGGGPLENLV